MIPEAAVEAAYDAALHLPITNSEIERILDAAAPHMLAEAWDEGGRAAVGTHDTGYPSSNPYRPTRG